MLMLLAIKCTVAIIGVLFLHRYYVFTSKHLEGYPMWPSTYSFGYNSMDVGPKIDVVGKLEQAFRKNHPHIHFGLYYCLWEFNNPVWLQDMANNKTTRFMTYNTYIGR